MPPSIRYDGTATISTGGSGSGVKLKRGQSESQSPRQGSGSESGSRSRPESFKSIYRVIHCPRRNTTYEGYILVSSQGRSGSSSASSSSSSTSSKGRRKKKHHDIYQTPAQDVLAPVTNTGTSASEPLELDDYSYSYIKHGKGVLYDHTNHTILTGYFQHDAVVGHALQTIYDHSGRHALAQYEGTFRAGTGTGTDDGDDEGDGHDSGGWGGGGLLVRHGKGKISWHGTNDVYSGEFHNGIMQGMGTFTWGANGNRYEGPFVKGHMHTHTNTHNHNRNHNYAGGPEGSLSGRMVTMHSGDVFVGGWRKGLMHGWGQKSFGNGDLFCGYYHRDVRQGYGSYHWQNGDVYVGAWDDGGFCNKSRGRGVKALVKMKTTTSTIQMDATAADADADALLANANENDNDNNNDEDATNSRRSDITEVYHGEWCGDVAHGHGMKQYSNGDYYLGEFIDDMRHGYGTYKWSNGDVYEGEFVNGLCTGLGLKRMVVVSNDDDDNHDDADEDDDNRDNGNDHTANIDIDIYDGEWIEDKANGYGVKIFGATGDIHMGLYQNDERHGHGLYRWAATGNEYEGDFREGEQTGFGTFRWMNARSARAMTDFNAPLNPNTDEDVDVDANFSNANANTNTDTGTHDNALVYSGKWKDGRKNGPGFLRVRAHVEVDGILHSVEKVYFDLYIRGTRVSRHQFDIAMDTDGARNVNADTGTNTNAANADVDVNVGLSSWDDADMEACLEQLRAKQMCWRELRREHFKSHT